MTIDELLTFLVKNEGRATAAQVRDAFGITQDEYITVSRHLVSTGFAVVTRGRGGGLRVTNPGEENQSNESLEAPVLKEVRRRGPDNGPRHKRPSPSDVAARLDAATRAATRADIRIDIAALEKTIAGLAAQVAALVEVTRPLYGEYEVRIAVPVAAPVEGAVEGAVEGRMWGPVLGLDARDAVRSCAAEILQSDAFSVNAVGDGLFEIVQDDGTTLTAHGQLCLWGAA